MATAVGLRHFRITLRQKGPALARMGHCNGVRRLSTEFVLPLYLFDSHRPLQKFAKFALVPTISFLNTTYLKRLP